MLWGKEINNIKNCIDEIIIKEIIEVKDCSDTILFLIMSKIWLYVKNLFHIGFFFRFL